MNESITPPATMKLFLVDKAIRFLPAILVLPVWLAIGLRDDLFVASFREYYSLSIAMVFGSMIAGSTPLGGGVVAFPVSVLVVGFTPSQGRDFSLLVQSVGMTAASYLIVVRNADLLERHGVILANAIFFSLMGLIIGFQTTISPFVAMCTYTTLVVAFALILAYVENFLQKQENALPLPEAKEDTTPGGDSSRSQKDLSCRNVGADALSDNSVEETEDAGKEVSEQEGNTKNSKTFLLGSIAFIAFSLFGGFVSSQVGTGADITWFAYCSLIHNSRRGVLKMSSNELTATSVIVMATTSIFGTILRVSTPGTDAVTMEAYYALMACACIVIVGAPVGSLFLSPNHQKRLTVLFYILALVQLASFGIIKIKKNATAWFMVGGILGAICIAIVLADAFVFQTDMCAKILFCRR